MEAAALGTYFAGMDDYKLEQAIAILSQASSHLDKAWLSKALDVMMDFPRSKADCERFPSLGIPTWLYSSEPTNMFSTKIAKIFQNSIREDFLSNYSTHGVVFFQGSFGTMQEMFMVAALHHYNFSHSPMSFFGKQFWEEANPIYPVLKQLSSKSGWSRYLSIHDSEQGLINSVAAAAQDQDVVAQQSKL